MKIAGICIPTLFDHNLWSTAVTNTGLSDFQKSLLLLCAFLEMRIRADFVKKKIRGISLNWKQNHRKRWTSGTAKKVVQKRLRSSARNLVLEPKNGITENPPKSSGFVSRRSLKRFSDQPRSHLTRIWDQTRLKYFVSSWRTLRCKLTSTKTSQRFRRCFNKRCQVVLRWSQCCLPATYF